MSKMFVYEVWPSSARRHAVDAPDKKKHMQKDIPISLTLFSVTITMNKVIDCVQHVRTHLMAIFHIEAFVTFPG